MKEIHRDIRLQVMINQDELKAIEDYQFGTRLQNRADAVRELIRLGLAAHRARSSESEALPRAGR